MPKKKLSNKQSFIAVIIIIVACVTIIYYEDIESIFLHKQPSNMNLMVSDNKRNSVKINNSEVKVIENVRPIREYSPPDYNDLVIAAKILKQAKDKDSTMEWLLGSVSTHDIKMKTEYAKLLAEKEKYMKEAYEHIQQRNYIKNNPNSKPLNTNDIISGPLNNLQNPFFNKESINNGTNESTQRKGIRVIGYSKKNRIENSYATLLIDGETYSKVISGQVVSNFLVENLNDKTKCVSLFKEVKGSDSVRKISCFN